MQAIQVTPGGVLSGTITIPGDKSVTHRALILAAIHRANTRVVLRNWLQSLDCLATLHILEHLGVKTIRLNHTDLALTSVGLHGLVAPTQTLDVGNAGTSMRLLTGLLCAQRFDSEISGDSSIQKRPMQRIITPLTQMGAKITAQVGGLAPLQIYGGQRLQAINYALPMASAQVKSAILLADLYTGGHSTITSPSICRDHTELMLQFFKTMASDEITISIPSDISSAAFFMVAATVTPHSDLTMLNIGINPTRSAVIEILRAMGAQIECQNMRTLQGEIRADIRVRYSANLQGVTVAPHLIANAIDEIPILCLAAACAKGVTLIRGAQELRHKESDRLKMLGDGFTRLGVEVATFEDGLAIMGGTIGGGKVVSGGDHRIAMTFILAGLVAMEPIIVQDTANIATSFPGFMAIAKNAGLIGESLSCPT